jgi:hypothetical protein
MCLQWCYRYSINDCSAILLLYIYLHSLYIYIALYMHVFSHSANLNKYKFSFQEWIHYCTVCSPHHIHTHWVQYKYTDIYWITYNNIVFNLFSFFHIYSYFFPIFGPLFLIFSTTKNSYLHLSFNDINWSRSCECYMIMHKLAFKY